MWRCAKEWDKQQTADVVITEMIPAIFCTHTILLVSSNHVAGRGHITLFTYHKGTEIIVLKLREN